MYKAAGLSIHSLGTIFLPLSVLQSYKLLLGHIIVYGSAVASSDITTCIVSVCSNPGFDG